MEQEEICIALSNYGWNEELPQTFVSKSSAVSVHVGAAHTSVRLHGVTQALEPNEYVAVNKVNRSVSVGAIDLKAQN